MNQTQIITPEVRPRWEDKYRNRKASAILATLKHFSSFNLTEGNWLDLGCGSGGIAAALVPHTRHMTAIDPEPWPEWPDLIRQNPNLTFLQGSYAKLLVPANSLDVVICNQVYEHVADPIGLIHFIRDTLRPGGLAYFAGPNLLFPIEPHVFWPFVHWLPRSFAVRLMHICGSHKVLDAYSKTYWQLRHWLADFEIINAVPYILRNPAEYGRGHIAWRLLSAVPVTILDILTCLSPAFVFILRKPPV